MAFQLEIVKMLNMILKENKGPAIIYVEVGRGGGGGGGGGGKAISDCLEGGGGLNFFYKEV